MITAVCITNGVNTNNYELDIWVIGNQRQRLSLSDSGGSNGVGLASVGLRPNVLAAGWEMG